MKWLLVLTAVILANIVSAQDEPEDTSEVPVSLPTAEKPMKFAPAYCRSFRLGCDKQKDHVCCRFPLPPTNGVPKDSSLRPSGIRIRPFRLPHTKNPEDKKVEEQPASVPAEQSEPLEPQEETSVQSKEVEAETPVRIKPLGGSLFKRRPSYSSVKSPPKEDVAPATEDEAEQTAPKSPLATPPLRKSSSLMPKICQRLPVNCELHPTHHCCKHKVEEPTTETSNTEIAAVEADGEPVQDSLVPEVDQQYQQVVEEERQSPGEPLDEAQPDSPPAQEEATGQQNYVQIPPQPTSDTLPQPPQEVPEQDFAEPQIIPLNPPADTVDENLYATEGEDYQQDQESQYQDAPDAEDPVPTITVVDIVSGQVAVQPSPPQGAEPADGPFDDEEPLEYYEYEDFPAYPAVAQKEAILAQPSAGVYQKIPAECFTRAYDCVADPDQICCSYQRRR